MDDTSGRLRWGAVGFAIMLIFAGATGSWATDGHFLHAVGAIDSAMGGAGTAAPLDAVGMIFNNVGAATDIPGFRVDFSFELFHSDKSISSTLGGVSGTTKSDGTLSPIPAFGLVYTPENSRVTYFLGALGILGFGVDYPQDNNNPILRPQIAGGMNTGGFGHLFSNYQLLKIVPGAAFKVTDHLSIGVAPNIDYATLGIEPMPAATPDCTPTGVCAYPSAANQVASFGAGFQVGAHYGVTDWLHLGLGYTSPQWFEKFEWNSSVANPMLSNFGSGRRISFRMDVPQTIAFGVAVEPRKDVLLVANTKWINYANTAGFDKEGFDPATGAVRGFGWRNIWSFGVGAQYKPLDWLALRLGYNYSQNPVPEHLTFFNPLAPAIAQHHLTAGLGFNIFERVEANIAYYHAFANSITGPIVHPQFGPIPGSSVTSKLSEDSVVMSVSYKFGSQAVHDHRAHSH
jgi:long-chain fatty acid transport protein